MKSSLVYASPNILDASSKEDVAVAMVLRGNGYNNEDKDRCDEFFQSLLSSSVSKRLLVTRPQHLLTVHFRYGFHALHYSCHISLSFPLFFSFLVRSVERKAHLIPTCKVYAVASTIHIQSDALQHAVSFFFIFTIVFIVKVSVFSFFMLIIFFFCC